MKITRQGDYALRALLALAFATEDQKTLSIRQISETDKIPYKFLEQIMVHLKKTGFVKSTKGKYGGYCLARPAQKITLGEVIRAVEGPLSPIGTQAEIKKRIQTEEHHPGLYCVLLDVRNAISEILDKKTLADVCEKSFELAKSKTTYQMYYI